MSTRRTAALPLAGFGLIALGVYATAFVLTASPLFARGPRAISVGLTLDLLVTVPAAFWLLVVRPRRLPWYAVLPAVVAGAYVGRLALPADERGLLVALRFLVAPAELWLLGWGGLRAWRLLRSGAHPRGDVLAAVRAALGEIVRYPRVADVVAAEVAVFWYALLSWRAEPSVASGARAFTQHRKSGTMGLVGALAAACMVETAVVHLLVSGWSAKAAWLLTALSVYGVLWLVGIARSILLRPTVVSADALTVRIGMLSEAVVPLARIASVTELRGAATVARRAPGYLHASIFAAPRLMIELSEPVEARGLYGNRKQVTRIGLLVDEPRALAEALRQG
jgi:hypothetical protein